MMASTQPRRAPINLLSLIAVVIFIVALAGAGGSFFYQSYLSGRITSDEQSLNLTQGQFDPATINQIIRLDSRLNIAGSLLSQHVALSNLFAALESSTIQTVRFTNFTFALDDQNNLTLTMTGEAVGFSDVALQTAAFNKTPYFKNLTVSGLSLEPTGAVSFSVVMTVDQSLLAYTAPTGATVSAPTLSGTTTPVSVSTTTVNSLSASSSANTISP